ncbi:ABC transporter ATP-binding protein [Prosthecomicrobium sp. N25]|uniref:ABC transporter ATP-binding protein n=1 Tax=Prosthecomicrobium sp. N25 TaxID=3129254 RepID=UPI0030784ED4
MNKPLVAGGARDIARASTLVAFRGVSKTYDGKTHVVKDLDLAIGKGEFLTLLGPSGSGKTTCLMMLAGFEVPTSGEIYLADRPLSKKPPHERGIGMVFQNYALFPHMTVAQNIAFPLEVRRMGRAEVKDKVARALDMVRLPHVADRKPSQLSGGQQQRIALARALVFEPEIVLMDEPLGALDKQLREHMQYEIRSLHMSLGLTMVYVTHDQSEALTMSDRIAVFAGGHIRQVADPRSLYQEPADGLVATFVGESNRFDGTILGRSGDTVTVGTVGGARIEAQAVDVGAAGPCAVIVRPEHIRIGPAADGLPDSIPGRVVDVVYHGDHLQVHISAGGLDVVAKQPAHGLPAPDVGVETRFGFARDHARAYDPARTDH